MVANAAAPAVHQKYADVLGALSGDTALLPVIHEAGARSRWWAQGREWGRTFGRFDPGREPFATLLFETVDLPQDICVVSIFEDCPPERDFAEIMLRDSSIGWLRVTRFVDDPRLPGLQSLFRERAKLRVLRYRPYKRCTIRCEDLDHGRTCFAKVFADDRGAVIHEEGLHLWEAAKRGDLGFTVAQSIRWDSATRTLWQGSVDGQPVTDLLFELQSGSAMAERMGRAAASLANSGLQPSISFTGDDQLKRSQRYATELRRRIPALAQDIDTLMRNLETANEATRTASLRPIHGAPHAHQWLHTGTQLGLVDFDRLCVGHPELDVATFLAEMDFMNSENVPVQSINRGFVGGYESVAGPLDRSLVQTYRAHKRLAKALKAARGVRPDGYVRAERNLRRAQACIKEHCD